MQPSGWRRVCAWGVDCIAALLWAGVLAAVVWPQRDRPGLARLGQHPLLENLVAFTALVLPVTVALAGMEHRWGRTPGKWIAGLRVVARLDWEPPPTGRALARNAVKVALPWGIGHAAVYQVTDGPATPTSATLALVALAYVLPVVCLVAMFSRRLRAPHDLVAGTAVVPAR